MTTLVMNHWTYEYFLLKRKTENDGMDSGSRAGDDVTDSLEKNYCKGRELCSQCFKLEHVHGRHDVKNSIFGIGTASNSPEAFNSHPDAHREGQRAFVIADAKEWTFPFDPGKQILIRPSRKFGRTRTRMKGISLQSHDCYHQEMWTRPMEESDVSTTYPMGNKPPRQIYCYPPEVGLQGVHLGSLHWFQKADTELRTCGCAELNITRTTLVLRDPYTSHVDADCFGDTGLQYEAIMEERFQCFNNGKELDDEFEFLGWYAQQVPDFHI